MFARAELNLGSERLTTLLPRDALVYRGEQPGVYIIESDAAKFLPVETGITQDDKVEVLNGLKVGDVVITRGSNLIKDGDRVRVQDQRPPAQQVNRLPQNRKPLSHSAPKPKNKHSRSRTMNIPGAVS